LDHPAPAGALQAAVSVVRENATYPGSIGKMVEPIVPAVLKAQGQAGDLLDNAVRENVRRTVNRLRTAEALLVDALKAGKLKIVGARYDLDDGSVGFFDEGWERTDLLLLKRRSASTDAGGDLACAFAFRADFPVHLARATAIRTQVLTRSGRARLSFVARLCGVGVSHSILPCRKERTSLA
jgi:hypothetical protein